MVTSHADRSSRVGAFSDLPQLAALGACLPGSSPVVAPSADHFVVRADDDRPQFPAGGTLFQFWGIVVNGGTKASAANRLTVFGARLDGPDLATSPTRLVIGGIGVALHAVAVSAQGIPGFHAPGDDIDLAAL